MGAALILVAALATPPAPSTGARPGGPLDGGATPTRIEADEIQYNWTTRTVRVVGKPWVTLRRADMTLTCRRLDGLNDEKGQLLSAVCEGDVRLVRGTRIVTCDRATYERLAGRVTCDGSPRLQDGAAEARGKRLIYDLDADEVRLVEAVQATVPSDQLDLRKGQGALRPKETKP